MRMLKPDEPSGGIGCALFLLAFGLTFVAVGLDSGKQVHDAFRVGMTYFLFGSFGSLLFMVFGLLIVLLSLTEVLQLLRFGNAQAAVSPEVIRPGDSFTFTYRQPIHRGTQIQALGVFLVYREWVDYRGRNGNGYIKCVDRLFQQFKQAGRFYSAGEKVEIECPLHVPEGEMGIRNAYMTRMNPTVKARWVVKVHLYRGKGRRFLVERGFWGEYDLGVTCQQDATRQESRSLDGLYDVWLTGDRADGKRAMTDVMRDLLPHLHLRQIEELCSARPRLLREGISVSEAEEIQKRLEAVGAEVDIKPVAVGG